MQLGVCSFYVKRNYYCSSFLTIAGPNLTSKNVKNMSINNFYNFEFTKTTIKNSSLLRVAGPKKMEVTIIYTLLLAMLTEPDTIRLD